MAADADMVERVARAICRAMWGDEKEVMPTEHPRITVDTAPQSPHAGAGAPSLNDEESLRLARKHFPGVMEQLEAAPPPPAEPDVDGLAAFEAPHWDGYIPAAIAAIAAMREPTAAMLNAGCGTSRWPELHEGTRRMWRAMVDAALAGPPGPSDERA